MLNKIVLCGRTTTDIELKATATGKSVASFTLAVERDFSSNGERETDFIPVVVWGKTAEFASSYFRKGKMMIAEGRLQIRKYTDKDGNNRTISEVIADKIYFCGEKNDNAGNTTSFNNATASDFSEIDTDDDMLPF